MSDFPPDLSDRPRGEWLGALRALGQERGFAEALGREHAAIFIEQGDTLLVSFETMSGVEALSETRTPLGFDMVGRAGWSCLSLLSHGDTWFRDAEVYAFFDNLLDDGFFDDFETVIFQGAGPCGYAAAAFSVASPGARVFAVQPQATLDPRRAGWDDRFLPERHRDFTSRYGFAPQMLDGAMHASILHDPYQRLDAMHASLFYGPNVSHHRMPFFGGSLLGDLLTLDLWAPLLMAEAEGRLDAAYFAQLLRGRRDHLPYLRKLLAFLDGHERTYLSKLLCEHVVGRRGAPRFRRRLNQIRALESGTEGLGPHDDVMDEAPQQGTG